MGTTQPMLLTVNAGSSSIKMALFLVETLECQLELAVTDIGQPGSVLTLRESSQALHTQPAEAANHAEAMTCMLKQLAPKIDVSRLAAVGHRLVHGGPTFDEPVVLTREVLQQLAATTAFDPEHAPRALALIETLAKQLPDVTQIACFDTTFYKQLPAVARLLPLPRKFEKLGLRRYGFHGLSYQSLLDTFRGAAGEAAANGRVIFAHLGSGASLTAMRNGKVMDTTMSFSPASGIPMSSRSGDLDPGIVDFLHRQTGMTTEAFNHMVHFESGLLGISELSPDMHRLLEESSHNAQAAEAVELFCYQVRKAIGSLAAVIGGLDSLIFAGGIGEQAPSIRANVCRGLEYLGILLDDEKNQAHDFLISGHESRVGVHAVETNEAVVIAMQTKNLIVHKA